MDLSDEGRLAQYDREQAARAQDALLAKRKAAMEFQSERRDTANKKALFGPSYNPDDPDWGAEMAGLKKSPEARWWEANDQQALAAPAADATPGGAHLMGRGDTIRTPLDSLSALASNVTAQRGSYGTPAGASGGKSGTFEVTPGGNTVRGPAMDEMDIEKLKQARLQTEGMEQSLPNTKAEHDQNEAVRGMNTGTDALLAQHSGEMKGTAIGAQNAAIAKAGAQSMMDPDVWREQEYKRKWAIEAQQPKVDIAQGKNDADIRKAQLAAWAKTQAETIKGDSAQKIAVARLIEESLADAGNSFSAPDQEALRALAAELKGQSSLLSPAAAALIRGPQ